MMTCQICSHPERAAIDKALVDQRSLRDVSGQYEVSRSSLDRHKKHIPKALAKAKHAETVAETTTLLSRVDKLAARCESLAEKAERDSDWRGAAAAARELRGCLELLARLNGELQPNGARVGVAINFGDIASLDIRTLTDKQLQGLCARVMRYEAERAADMTQAEIESEVAGMVLGSEQDMLAVREAILFDLDTVPPGLGYETNMRYDPKKPWRNASPEDRYRMLAAAWKRETGEDLVATLEDLGPRAVMEIEFDFFEERDWMAWPLVRLKHLRPTPNDHQTGSVQILPPVSRLSAR